MVLRSLTVDFKGFWWGSEGLGNILEALDYWVSLVGKGEVGQETEGFMKG